MAVTAAAVGFEAVETHLFGRAWLEALVLAILLGSAIRTAWTPSQRFFPGIAFGAKTVLEIAVVMLGASLSLATILAAGPGLLFGIAGVVVVAILSSYGIGRRSDCIRAWRSSSPAATRSAATRRSPPPPR